MCLMGCLLSSNFCSVSMKIMVSRLQFTIISLNFFLSSMFCKTNISLSLGCSCLSKRYSIFLPVAAPFNSNMVYAISIMYVLPAAFCPYRFMMNLSLFFIWLSFLYSRISASLAFAYSVARWYILSRQCLMAFSTT